MDELTLTFPTIQSGHEETYKLIELPPELVELITSDGGIDSSQARLSR